MLCPIRARVPRTVFCTILVLFFGASLRSGAAAFIEYSIESVT
jgi:hypothetical protein